MSRCLFIYLKNKLLVCVCVDLIFLFLDNVFCGV